MAEVFVADCQARLAFDLFANTWNPVVLMALREGPRRPARLRAEIGGIRPKVLTETLRRLERAGLVARTAVTSTWVEYALTELGHSLLEPMSAFGRWSELHADEVVAAQERAAESGRC